MECYFSQSHKLIQKRNNVNRTIDRLFTDGWNLIIISVNPNRFGKFSLFFFFFVSDKITHRLQLLIATDRGKDFNSKKENNEKQRNNLTFETRAYSFESRVI